MRDVSVDTANGINFDSTAGAKLFVSDSIIADNDGYGIVILGAPSTTSRLMLDSVRLEKNRVGILAISGSTIIGQIRNSVFTGNRLDGVRAFGTSSGVNSITVDRS